MTKSFHVLLISFLFLFVACGSEDSKEAIEPQPIELVSNTTFSDLKNLLGNKDYYTITEDLVVEGKVISSDFERNFYESIVINETKENAGFSGLEILIAEEDLEQYFAVGQKVLVKCKGLSLGKNQLGASTVSENGTLHLLSIDGASVFNYVVKTKDVLPVAPELIGIPEIIDNMNLSLIKLDAVQFIDADLEKKLGDANADVKRTIIDKDGNTLALRIRKTANFRDTKIPLGNGSVIGILVKVNGNFELIIRELSELAMTGERFGDDFNTGTSSDHEKFLTPEVDAEGKIIVRYTPKEYVTRVEEGQHMMSVRIPGNYYSSAISLSGTDLRNEIREIISTGADKLSYTTVWDMCEDGDENPTDASQVWQLYVEKGIAKTAHVSGSTGWNREHVWAKSHGDFGTSAGPGTDGHHLRASDAQENGNRGNLDFANVNGARTKNGSFYEPPKSAKGDVARSIFYMAVRYGFTVDDLGGQGTDARHGKLEDLLEWNELDPVDSYEIRRNNVIYGYQHNRNPFIDHPELVRYIFGDKKAAVWKD